MKYGVLFLLLFSTLAIAQDTLSHTFDCSKLTLSSTGCLSYNEMVRSYDKDLFDAFKNSNETFVCFRSGEDVFMMISYSIPDEIANSPRLNSESKGSVIYRRFKDGTFDELKMAFGTWLKNPAQNLLSFVSPDNVKNHAAVDDGEVAFDYSFTNRESTTTIYNLQIRRSTLRFKESYTWDDPPASQKNSKAPVTLPKHTESGTEITGHCAEFVKQ
jgi:hypothetical protein